MLYILAGPSQCVDLDSAQSCDKAECYLRLGERVSVAGSSMDSADRTRATC